MDKLTSKWRYLWTEKQHPDSQLAIQTDGLTDGLRDRQRQTDINLLITNYLFLEHLEFFFSFYLEILSSCWSYSCNKSCYHYTQQTFYGEQADPSVGSRTHTGTHSRTHASTQTYIHTVRVDAIYTQKSTKID